jgi:hypothetical protein
LLIADFAPPLETKAQQERQQRLLTNPLVQTAEEKMCNLLPAAEGEATLHQVTAEERFPEMDNETLIGNSK